MQRLARLILIFAILSAVFIIAPAFLNRQFALYPLIKEGDVLDLLTPLVLIPLYWSLFNLSRDRSPSQKEILAFLVLTGLWVEGQGMHLAANSIGHLIQPSVSNEIKTLTHFYDEILSHYIWHFGIVGLSALLIYRQWKNPFFNKRSELRLEIGAGIIYGFVYFIDVVESATTPLGVPFAVGVVIFTLFWGWQNLHKQPILVFFLVTYFVASLLFLGWGLYWGGLPEFSKVGIID